jgi:hypothetical protein
VEKDNRFVYLILSVITLFLLYWAIVNAVIDTSQNRGLFGDMFGGANAMFSALAFAAVAYSIFHQRKELALQKDDLEQTRIELAKTTQLNALATLARTYSESLTWLTDNNKDSSAIAAVSRLHREAIVKVEEMCGMTESIYD